MTPTKIHRLHILDVVGLILMIVGGLNWLLVGVFGLNLVSLTFGAISTGLERLIYLIVGIAAIYSIVRLPAMTHYRYEPAERERYVPQV